VFFFFFFLGKKTGWDANYSPQTILKLSPPTKVSTYIFLAVKFRGHHMLGYHIEFLYFLALNLPSN